MLGERRGGYLAFGLLSGLGLLAKANFAFVPVALLLAAASSAEFRPRLRPPASALGVALAAAIVAVPAAWMLAHSDLALGSAHKFERRRRRRAVRRRARGPRRLRPVAAAGLPAPARGWRPASCAGAAPAAAAPPPGRSIASSSA